MAESFGSQISDQRLQGRQNGNGQLVTGFLIILQFQISEVDLVQMQFDRLLFQLFQVCDELLKIGVLRIEHAGTIGMMRNEGILGPIEIFNGRAQAPLTSSERPTSRVCEAVAPENGHCFSFNDLCEMLPVQARNCFRDGKDLLIGELHKKRLGEFRERRANRECNAGCR